MIEEQNRKPYFKRWWFWGLVVLVLIVIGSITGGEENIEVQEAAQNQEEQPRVDILQYSVLDKIEDISTQMSDSQESYVGDILIEEDVSEVSPEDFIKIASVIAEKEGLNHSAAFYSSEEAYRANVGIYVPAENQELLEETGGGIQSNQEYVQQAEIDRLLSEGYIGNLEDGQFRMSLSSSYYKQHRGDGNKENDWIVR